MVSDSGTACSTIEVIREPNRIEGANEPIPTRMISPEALVLNQKVSEKGAGKRFRKEVQEKKKTQVVQ